MGMTEHLRSLAQGGALLAVVGTSKTVTLSPSEGQGGAAVDISERFALDEAWIATVIELGGRVETVNPLKIVRDRTDFCALAQRAKDWRS